MTGRSRGGFTLVELLVAMILLVIVGGGIYQTLLVVQRVSLRQTEVSATSGAVRTGLQLIQTELQEIATSSTATPGSPAAWSDIISANPASIRYYAMRGLGEICERSNADVKVRQASFAGLRVPAGVRDRILLFMDGDTTITTDDHWTAFTFTGGAGTASTCADDGLPSWTLTLTLTNAQRDSIWVPSPVRTLEEMEIGIVTDAGKDWLGIRSVGAGEGTLLPVVGPIQSLGFRYKDATDTDTGTLSAIRTITMTLTGITDRAVTSGVGSAIANPTETLQTIIQLRNSR